MKFNCVIVDDERPALKLLSAYLKKLPHLEIVAICENAFEALAALQTHVVDILFLDIQMPELTGLELLQTLQQKPQVILTTAYREYAVEGFELEVIDYLVKPFSFERFLQAVNKATLNLNQANTGSSKTEPSQSLNPIEPSSSPTDGYLFIKKNHRMEKVSLADILYVESMREYVAVFTPKKKYVIHYTMNTMEEKLALPNFMRVHRSYIIGLNHIETIMGNTLKIQGKEIPIGGSYRKSFFEKIDTL